MAAALGFGDAETMESVEMGRHLLQDLPIERLGLGDEATLLQQQGLAINAAHLLPAAS